MDIFESKYVLYDSEKNYTKNIFFDDTKLEDYLINKNLQLIKLKSLYKNYNNKIPDDFDVNSYKNLYHDLSHLTDKEAEDHFLKLGLYEGRSYKSNQDMLLNQNIKPILDKINVTLTIF